ncbi:MAG: bifunctional proline dehydrogenase/L-glutamate gamma-semialdehyde dehydrogenase PutA [Pseudomonadota bacterium]
MATASHGSIDLGRHHRMIAQAKYADENSAVLSLLERAPLSETARARALDTARAIITASRAATGEQGTLDAFLQEFGLSNEEGVALMCLAESLLRVPDAQTADRLIAEKIASGQWAAHKGQSRSLFVNASTWALMLTGRVIGLDAAAIRDPGDLIGRLVHRAGEPIIRQALKTAMRIMGSQFVLGRGIEEALARAGARLASFDMLGEGARTQAQAERYFAAYQNAIAHIGGVDKGRAPEHRHAISVKLSALHPRYEEAKRGRVESELYAKLESLARQAAGLGLNLTVDAEEADRLELSLDLIERIARAPALAGWDGFGLAVQAYAKRAPEVIDYVVDLARVTQRRLMVRLVKGAYWDSEIKWAQEKGVADYPVWTRKATTDVCYLVCAEKLLAAGAAIFPQFATHNAMTLASILEMAAVDQPLEFQRLHGMGRLLYKVAGEVAGRPLPVRVYGPVGSHEDLLPYLVRRLLENGANSSFVNRFLDQKVAVEEVADDPFAVVRAARPKRHPGIAPPPAMFGRHRRNAKGFDLASRATLGRLEEAVAQSRAATPLAAPIIAGASPKGEGAPSLNPADHGDPVARVLNTTPAQIEEAHARAREAQPAWDALGGEKRALHLDRAADLLEAEGERLIALIVREAGRTLPDAVAELREAVDFCRYYAAEARAKFAAPILLPGPTGEENRLSLHGRGVFVSIAPWNFPLAIFAGQMAAALAAGNAVLAKPAEQTPLVGVEAVKLFHRAGVPADVLHVLPGDGATGAALVGLPGIDGVVFTGSTEVARRINQALAAKEGPIVPLIAETGGQNAMVVDSTALLEQVTDDVVRSGFLSAGQRCSSLRLLLVQEDIADKLIALIAGAMAELTVGNPAHAFTDIGPIIDGEALARLEAHVARMENEARLLKRVALSAELEGTYFAPTLVEIPDLSVLPGEVFGPVVHLKRFKAAKLKEELNALNATGYGLTFGLHSRIDGLADDLAAICGCGNIYVNRNMVGAVVGVQPFGGRGLSGTGPKAGGPHYLLRFATERVVTVNTAATGGNADLLQLSVPEEG